MKLNEPIELFKEFKGPYIQTMPKLIKEGRSLLSVAGLMHLRLEALTASEEVKKFWWNSSFDTGDAVFYNPYGDFKVILDAQLMDYIDYPHPKRYLDEGSLIIHDNLYVLDGTEFTKNEIERYHIANRTCQLGDKCNTKDEAKSNPIWKALARENQALLNEYVDAVFSQAKEQGYDKNMEVLLAPPKRAPTAMLWRINSLNITEGSRIQSEADGRAELDFWKGYLIGIAPEVAWCAEKVLFKKP